MKNLREAAERVVESIRRWWKQWGRALYPGKKELLITADGGGSKKKSVVEEIPARTG